MKIQTRVSVTIFSALFFIAAGSIASAEAAPAPVAQEPCTPTVSLGNPEVSIPYAGRIELPTDWVNQFRAARGTLPSIVPGGHTVSGTHDIRLELYRVSGGQGTTLSASVPIQGVRDTPTDLRWVEHEDRMYLDFSTTPMPDTPPTYQALLNMEAKALKELLVAYPDYLPNGTFVNDQKDLNAYQIPLTYNNGCTAASVLLETQNSHRQIHAGGGGGVPWRLGTNDQSKD